ncbi:MAG: hypothetical protein C5B59_02985 [Bacteroidetes bacterium]|nr:MAG: hypothetical protein C5B59_02985 [Bacteroidota bacterium]
MADTLTIMQTVHDTSPCKNFMQVFLADQTIEAQLWVPVTFLVVLFCLIILIKYWRVRNLAKRINRLFEEKKAVYDEYLVRYNPYYKSLAPRYKDRFLRRTISFIQAKDFKYIGLEGEEFMPLLISATAVQLTFGLEHYLLDYLRTIYILKDSYRYGMSEKPFAGHVSDEGIFLSWSHFLVEFHDYTDGENVGLHEMAHALTYVNFRVQEGKDDSFRKKFSEFSPLARPVFDRMRAGETTLLDKYAVSSFEEFWAVSIETFFERPFPFREQLPEVYFGLCNLLNQDPLSPDKIQGNVPVDDDNNKNFLKTALETFKF